MDGPGVKARIVDPLQKSVLNPIVRNAFAWQIPVPGDALLETIGRRTGRRRRTPVCDGLVADTFWLVAQHGRRADYVRNIEANPRVRVRVSGSDAGWRAGTARVLDDDDPRLRQWAIGRSNVARAACVCASAVMATRPLTIRIDLDTG
jgi:deazaflavin-dependent oxidoreductase (nitroreductase family)